VIQIEQHRALQQNASRVYLRDFRGSELSLIAQSSSGCILSRLNRQIPELEHPVTSRKQTAETCSDCSNRQKLQKRLRPISKSTGFLSARDFARTKSQNWLRLTRENEAFLRSGHSTSKRFWLKRRSDRNETIKPCLTGARTAFSETGFNDNFQISSATVTGQFRLPGGMPCTPSQSSNLSRPYGRA
jgi:hypothetical protein